MSAILLQRVKSGFGAVEAGRISNDNTDANNPPYSPFILLPGQTPKTIKTIVFGVHLDPVYSLNLPGSTKLLGRMAVVKSRLATELVYDPIFAPSEFSNPVYPIGDFRQGDILFETPYLFFTTGVQLIEFPGTGLDLGDNEVSILVTPPYDTFPVTIAQWAIARLHLSVAGDFGGSPFSHGTWR